jgi:predicted ATPase/DNA-binding CsgD family transcriptional regulator
LITSRIPVRVPGEHIVAIDPLPVIANGEQVSLTDALGNESVSLLLHAVRRVGGDLEVTEANLTALLQICRRLDGLPLAIELAAARLRLVSPARLADMLDRPLAVLGGRATDPRRTLRATIEWSVGLLDPIDRERFAALGVFPGNFDLSGAAAVLDLDPVELLDSFDTLLDHHLIRPAESRRPGDRRFELLDTLRAYAVEQLSAGDAKTTRHWALARWCATLVSDFAAHMDGPRSAEAVERLDVEYASIRGVLGWLGDRAAGDGNASDLLLRMTGSLWQFWMLRGLAIEGSDWIDRAISASGDRRTRELAGALFAAGQLAELRGDLGTAEASFTSAAEVSEALGDDVGAADAWNGIGMVARTLGDPERARLHHERARTVFVAHGLRRHEATTLNNLAAIAYFGGDLPAAARLWTTTLALLREVDDERARGLIVGNLGSVQLALGDLPAAEAAYEEAIEIAEQFGDRYSILSALVNSIDVRIVSGHLEDVDDRIARARHLAVETDSRLALATLAHHEGRLAARRGRLGDAAALLAEGWHLVVDAEITTVQASSLEYLAMVAAEVGDHPAAGILLDAAARLRRLQLSEPLGPEDAALRHWTEVVERALGRTVAPADPVARLDPVDLAAVSESIDAFVFAARGVTRREIAPAPAWAHSHSLTAREAEIAALLLERRTDQEIADALVLSRRTVTTHVSAILRKLGVPSRRDVATVLLRRD